MNVADFALRVAVLTGHVEFPRNKVAIDAVLKKQFANDTAAAERYLWQKLTAMRYVAVAAGTAYHNGLCLVIIEDGIEGRFTTSTSHLSTMWYFDLHRHTYVKVAILKTLTLSSSRPTRLRGLLWDSNGW